MMNHAKLQRVFHRVLVERQRQDRLKEQGKFRFTCADDGLIDSEKYVVLGEEFGEVGRAVLNELALSTDYSEMPESAQSLMVLTQLRKELTEVAAVACAWLESLELEPEEGIQR